MGADQQQQAAAKASINASTVSRWLKSGKPGEAANVAAFARAYRKPVLEAFIAAGFLTPNEARARPKQAPDLNQLTNDELLELVRARMTEGSGEHAYSSTTTKTPASGPGLSVVDDRVSDLIAADHQEQSIGGEQEESQEP